MGNTLAFILGSGILDNPYIIPASIFFLVACLISIKACRILEKGPKKRRSIVYVYVLLMAISIAIALHLVAKGSAEQEKALQPEEKETVSIMKSVTL